MRGAGLPNQTTFDAAYNSAYASQNAASLAGADYSDANTKLLAAGWTSGAADTGAKTFCGCVAFSAGTQAGHTASDGSAKYVRVTRYGAGADPIIDGAGLVNACIETDQTSGGGFRIYNLELKRALAAGIHAEAATSSENDWIESCYIHDIDGMTMPPGGADNTPKVPGYSNAWPAGICARYVNRLVIKNCTITNTGAPLMLFECSKVWVENCSQTQSKYQSVWLLNVNTPKRCREVLFRGGIVDQIAMLGWPNGTAAFAFAGSADVMLEGVEISGTAPSGDGVAIDLESTCGNTTVWKCNIHDNAGAAFLNLVGTSTAGTIIADNTFTNNGTSDANFPALIRCDNTPSDTIIWLRNTTTRRASPAGQKLFAATSHATPNPTDTPNANWAYGPDNTVTP